MREPARSVRGVLRGAIATLVVAAAACSTERAPTGGSKIVAMSRTIREQMCACKDLRCTQELEARWSAVMASLGEPVEITDTETDQLHHELVAHTKCLVTIQTAHPPAGTPESPTAAAPPAASTTLESPAAPGR